ncbi:glycosyltransferase N-terminal domain-containing protein [Marivita sp. GX14005]|uniref:3-deoxy-D-manno-octulosonic acid transferase n=1 Tax=Marivita sp. GX14005 TaxID=2942276 RepID=UPI002018D8BA|nr:glycosyltransferase N-terminal domain-containing protein [Marivita sp. GX14005]MCL3881997.1 3-deoxy-D-manno-octulosonic acid transferase [Marivita sp. GX14005]
MVRKPFTLSAYLALARGRERQAEDAARWPDRPDGAVMWLHSDTRERLETLHTLIARLRLQRSDASLLLTCDATETQGFSLDGAEVHAPPPETLGDIERFLDHWRPDILIWAGNGLRPALISETSDRGAHMLLVDAEDAVWQQPQKRLLPDATPGALGLFHTIFAQNAQAAQRMRRLGVPASKIETATPIEREIVPLDSHDGLHEELTSALAGRPVWLAAGLLSREADAVMRAHRRACRLSHRLLLVVVPQDPDDEPEMAECCQQVGLRLARWDHGEMPDENTQVLLAGDDTELGLWYRISPLTFLGGSLVSGAGGQSPMMAAALGSAILYGPNVGNHLPAYSRLVSAGAARIVKDMESLSAAVTHLIAPDRAAAMAHAGWNVVSSGAETADMVLAQVNEWLDAIEDSP